MSVQTQHTTLHDRRHVAVQDLESPCRKTRCVGRVEKSHEKCARHGGAEPHSETQTQGDAGRGDGVEGAPEGARVLQETTVVKCTQHCQGSREVAGQKVYDWMHGLWVWASGVYTVSSLHETIVRNDDAANDGFADQSVTPSWHSDNTQPLNKIQETPNVVRRWRAVLCEVLDHSSNAQCVQLVQGSVCP
jgi:hypothetical protein